VNPALTSTLSEDDRQIVADLIDTVSEALKEASRLEEEVTKISGEKRQLQEDLLRKDRIILEKAANVPPRVTKEAAESLADTLVSFGLCKRADRTETVEQFMSNPDSIAKLAEALAPVSVSAPQQGAGIRKEASDRTSSEADPDGWNKVATEGA
jgi:dsDNA-specific endonuclease/ATPase MutS2